VKALLWFVGAILVTVLAAFIFLDGGSDSPSGPSGPGAISAARACSTFREAVLSAADGTSTAAEADGSVREARRLTVVAEGVNGDYRPLLVLLTGVEGGGGSGEAVLAECRRLGL